MDEWSLFFNGDDNFELVANQNDVYDFELYDAFKRGAEDE